MSISIKVFMTRKSNKCTDRKKNIKINFSVNLIVTIQRSLIIFTRYRTVFKRLHVQDL